MATRRGAPANLHGENFSSLREQFRLRVPSLAFPLYWPLRPMGGARSPDINHPSFPLLRRWANGFSNFTILAPSA
jgi:hypothetical protein